MTAAQERIRLAYDADLLQDAGARLAAMLGEHLSTVTASESRVLNWNPPLPNRDRAAEELRQPAADSSPAALERFGELVQLMLARGHNLHDPRYVGHQVPASIPLAGLFDAVGAVTNQVMAIYEMGPWATAVEQAMTDRLAEYLGWKGQDYGAIVTHGGSIANTTALLAARNRVLPDSWEAGTRQPGPAPVLISHADAHYCIARSAGILGLGTRQVIKADLDGRRRIDPAKLEARLQSLRDEGRTVIAVASSACATPIGAFDPIAEIAEVCERFGVWLHVDAAHGGAALLSRKYRSLLAGLERADSVVWDAHKMLFVPALCAFLFYKRKRDSYEAFKQDAPYLFDPSAPGLSDFDGGLRTMECTKRAATFGLWGTWSIFGPQLFEDLVDVTFDLGQTLHGMLTAAPDFEPLHEPQCNIVVFRHIPPALRGAEPQRIGDFQLRLRRRLIESGEGYLVHANFGGSQALRMTLINPLTTEQHLVQILDTIRRHGAAVLADVS